MHQTWQRVDYFINLVATRLTFSRFARKCMTGNGKIRKFVPVVSYTPESCLPCDPGKYCSGGRTEPSGMALAIELVIFQLYFHIFYFYCIVFNIIDDICCGL